MTRHLFDPTFHAVTTTLRLQRFAVAAAVSIALLASGAAIAQEKSELEEIVVTAQKREQPINEVPLSIQALDGEALSEANVRDLSEVINFVPGASEGLSNTIGQRQYQIRGISQGLGDSTVGYYFDDAAFFFYGQNVAPQGRTFDMNRVEVLRGPQSTLYGNGAMGGVVRFIPNAPNLNAYEGQVRAGYSTTDGGDPGYYVDGAVSLPLVDDKLALRLVGSHEAVGGYVENLFTPEQNVNDGDIQSWRASLLWQPTDKLGLKFIYLHNEANQNGGGTLLLTLDPPVSVGTPDDFNDNKFDLYTGTLTYDFDFASLASTTTYIDYQQDFAAVLPFPGAPNGLLEYQYGQDAQAFNNETRLVSQGDGPLQWLLGVFYSDTELKQPLTSNSPAIIPTTDQELKSKSISIFSEVSWNLLEGRLVPLVGLRYFTDDRSTVTDLEGVGTIDSGKGTFDSLSPRFNLSWHPYDTSMWYLNVAKGFRSGGFNNAAVCSLNPICKNVVDSDELWNYEAGTKQTLAAGRLALDAAVYYQDWKDVREGVPFFGVFQDLQVGDARLYGIDLGLAYSPESVAGLAFELSGNWNSSEFTRLDPAVAALSGEQVGNRVPLVPEWTVSASVSYEFVLPGDWKARSYLGLNHLEPQKGQFGGTVMGDSRDLLRARFGVTNGGFGAYLFGNNLLGEDGAVYAQNPAGGLTTYTQDYPRQIGVEFSYTYR